MWNVTRPPLKRGTYALKPVSRHLRGCPETASPHFAQAAHPHCCLALSSDVFIPTAFINSLNHYIDYL